jgi:ribonuclease BN (tRNA processing enzyme)
MLREVEFIGVGEACDPDYPNASLLLKDQAGQGRILLDCGFTTPHRYFRKYSDPEELQALWISHFHGDHFFGVPLLLLRFWEMGRRKPLHILGPQGVEEKICQAMDLAYPNFLNKIQFPLHFQAVEPGCSRSVAGLTWNTAENEHSERALAVRIEDKEKALFYSGDGRPTPETLGLAAGCDLVVHEAFRLSGATPGHGNVPACIDFAQKSGAKKLALLHINRDERATRLEKIQEVIRKTVDLHIFLPEPGDCFVL